LLAGAALPLGLLPRCPGVRILSASHVEFTTAAGIMAQADGDALAGSPYAIANAASPLALVAG
jgi:diacylglycerol kinase family enzyme